MIIPSIDPHEDRFGFCREMLWPCRQTDEVRPNQTQNGLQSEAPVHCSLTSPVQLLCLWLFHLDGECWFQPGLNHCIILIPQICLDVLVDILLGKIPLHLWDAGQF